MKSGTGDGIRVHFGAAAGKLTELEQAARKWDQGLEYISKLSGGEFGNEFGYSLDPAPTETALRTGSVDSPYFNPLGIKMALDGSITLKNAGPVSGTSITYSGRSLADSMDMILAHVAEIAGLKYGRRDIASRYPATSASQENIQKHFTAGVEKKAEQSAGITSSGRTRPKNEPAR